jgi:Zn-dependent protease with chaperone function
MTSARRLYRFNLALGGLGGLAVAAILAVALSKLSLTLPPIEDVLAACGRLLPANLSPIGPILLGFAVLALIVLLRGVRSALLQARAHVRVRAGLSQAVEEALDGMSVRLLQSSRPQAFCAGLLRPRVFLSPAARDRLSEAELRAVLAHEAHHVRRRDPLRLLAVRILADALFFLPALRRLERRYAELAELAADEAAVRTAGSAPLASALRKLSASDHPDGTVALAPERVDHLCGVPTRWRLEPRTLLLSLLAVTGIGGVAILAGIAAGGVRVEVLAVVVQSCMAVMLAVAVAGVAALWRRRNVDPSSGH